MKALPTLLLMLLSFASLAQTISGEEDRALQQVFDMQRSSWGRGDWEGFMSGYWQSDSLLFIGHKGPKRGWQATLDTYKKSYDSAEKRGTLSFEILEKRKLAPGIIFVLGKWQLSRQAGDAAGHFSIIFKNIEGKWLIVSDHSG